MNRPVSKPLKGRKRMRMAWPSPERLQRTRTTLEAHQVRIYLVAMACGALLGWASQALVPGQAGQAPGQVAEQAGQGAWLDAAINPALALMLLATFLQVPLAGQGARWRAALGHGRFLAALVLSHFVLLPLVVAALVQVLPPDPMLRLGVLLVLLAPCIDYVITFTHLGGGHARALLAMTPALLLLQMLLLPLYLGLLLGEQAAGLVVAGPFVQAFVWLIALPLVLALALVLQLLASRRQAMARLVDGLGLLPVPATALVLLIVPAAVMQQMGLIGHAGQPTAVQAALQAAPVYVAFALLAPLVGWLAARALRLDAPRARAVCFSAAYRNSFVILPLAMAVPGGVPLLPAVILTQTITELCFLPLYLRCLPRLAR